MNGIMMSTVSTDRNEILGLSFPTVWDNSVKWIGLHGLDALNRKNRLLIMSRMALAPPLLRKVASAVHPLAVRAI